MKRNSLRNQSILITFDDCFQSVKRYAYPILKKYGFHAAAFVVTSWLHDEPKEFNPDQSVTLTKSDLEEMTDVFQYANHTNAFHQRTDEKTSMMMATSDEEFSKDLDKCNEYRTSQGCICVSIWFIQREKCKSIKRKRFYISIYNNNRKK